MVTSRTSQMARSLSRRAAADPSVCGGGNLGRSPGYDTPLHVGALFIILFVSSSACAFPLIVIRFPRLRIPSSFLFLARHFGTGVLIATAFVHLLPTAFLSLTDPCLSGFWTDDYPAMPGAIALAAVFLVTVIEMVFSPGQHACAARPVNMSSSTMPGGDVPAQGRADRTGATLSRRRDDSRPVQAHNEDSNGEYDQNQASPSDEKSTSFHIPLGVLRHLGPLRGRKTSVGRELQRMGEEDERLDQIEEEALQISTCRSDNKNISPKKEKDSLANNDDDHVDGGHNHDNSNDNNDDNDNHRHKHSHDGAGDSIELQPLTPEQKRQKSLMQCMLLEMGILFHSVFIGMALSVSIGSDFVVLLIAITFHQTFEGLALGSRIASLKWNPSALQPWMMALAYGSTTPIGQAIGLATHTLYDPDSETGLLLVGTMNAISAGLLIFASLVELMSEDFLSDESWRILRGRRRVGACVLVFLGAFGMSLIGAWA
ncbi:hypothetical protein VTN00DRAFT_8415 [Thermoascus crustaceus]|uniref:uncharacterized protein n=1 Tax=Thermoascus crustaceus TaxID=5088 RepID=UPI003742F2C7